MVALQLKQLDVPPGHRVLFHQVSWQEFEEILEELGERRNTRLAYSRGTLEIVAPLPEHEIAKGLLGDLVKILLEELNMDCEVYGSTTFKRADMGQGIEPDESFYIQNHAQMIGRERIDMSFDPPPDLAIEVDITSKTGLDAYEALQVPELWRYENRKLRIDILQNGKYVQSDVSLAFPDLPVIEGITEYINRSRTIGRSPALRAFRLWVKEQKGE
jgi:Uma2 family endonuclease